MRMGMGRRSVPFFSYQCAGTTFNSPGVPDRNGPSPPPSTQAVASHRQGWKLESRFQDELQRLGVGRFLRCCAAFELVAMNSQ
jgi:hypothetical protein